MSEPAVRLLDARVLGLHEEGALREHARRMSEAESAPFASRSYSYPFALLVWHTGPVGCDIERIVPCDTAFADSIRTPAERAAAAVREAAHERADRDDANRDDAARYGVVCDAARSHAVDHDRRIVSLWSSKEALSKALGNARDYDPRQLEGPDAWPDGRSGPWRAREVDLAGDHVGWVCWRDGDGGGGAGRGEDSVGGED